MISLSRDEMRGEIILMYRNITPHDSAKHYYFSRGGLYYPWKPKDRC